MSQETKPSQNHIIRCHCGDVREHAIHISQYNTGHDADDSKIGMCTVNLSMDIAFPWYKRAWIGLKYIFGYSNGIHYMDTMVDVEVLKGVVNKLEDERTDAQKETSKEQRNWMNHEVV